MLRFGKTKVVKVEFYGGNKPIKHWDFAVNNTVISLVLMLTKMSAYVKIIWDKDGDKDKNKNNELTSSRLDNNKLLEKYKTIWTKTEVLKIIELNALQIQGGRYIESKIRRDGDKVYTNIHSLDMPHDGLECESVTIASIDFFTCL